MVQETTTRRATRKREQRLHSKTSVATWRGERKGCLSEPPPPVRRKRGGEGGGEINERDLLSQKRPSRLDGKELS